MELNIDYTATPRECPLTGPSSSGVSDKMIGDPTPATSWEICTQLCMTTPECESVYWDVSPDNDDTPEDDIALCSMFKASTDTADRTCGHVDLIGGRKCSVEHECQPLVCDYCAEHGYTMNEGCTYSTADDMDADSRVINVLTYEECTNKCTATSGCVAVSYYTKYYASATLESLMTNDIATDGFGPMLCVLKKSTTTMTCGGNEHYQEVVSGEPCSRTAMENVIRWIFQMNLEIVRFQEA